MSPWPWPGDSATERARRVANSYRAALVSRDPDAAAILDEHWIHLDQGWVAPSNAPLRVDDWLTAQEMSELLCISAKSVYMLGHRARVRVHMANGVRRYRVGDLIEYAQERRKWRARALP